MRPRSFLAAATLTLFAVVMAACGSVVAPTDAGSGGNKATGGGGGGTGGNGTGGGDGGDCDGKTCKAGEVCVYSDHQCGKGNPTRVCVQFPASCGEDQSLYCGCDGTIVGGCELNTTTPDQCVIPKGKFVCGSVICDSATQYCMHNKFGMTDEADCYPAGLCNGAPTCDCALASAACPSATCDSGADGITVTCTH